MFDIKCKAIASSKNPNVDKYATYKGTYDEVRETFCIVTHYDAFICKANVFDRFFLITEAKKLK